MCLNHPIARALQGMCVCVCVCVFVFGRESQMPCCSFGFDWTYDQRWSMSIWLNFGHANKKNIWFIRCDPARRRPQLIRPVTIHLLCSPSAKMATIPNDKYKLQRRTLQSNRTLARDSIPHETAKVTFEQKSNIVYSSHSRQPKSAKRNRFILFFAWCIGACIREHTNFVRHTWAPIWINARDSIVWFPLRPITALVTRVETNLHGERVQSTNNSNYPVWFTCFNVVHLLL